VEVAKVLGDLLGLQRHVGPGRRAGVGEEREGEELEDPDHQQGEDRHGDQDLDERPAAGRASCADRLHSFHLCAPPSHGTRAIEALKRGPIETV